MSALLPFALPDMPCVLYHDDTWLNCPAQPWGEIAISVVDLERERCYIFIAVYLYLSLPEVANAIWWIALYILNKYLKFLTEHIKRAEIFLKSISTRIRFFILVLLHIFIMYTLIFMSIYIYEHICFYTKILV